jgi:hypothetical protein
MFKSQTIKEVLKEVMEEVEKLPKYDLSKSGIGGEMYLKKQDILTLLKDNLTS